MEELATVIVNEAGPACPLIAWIAIAHVYSRNKNMTGKHGPAPPTYDAYMIATWWYTFEDPTHGAYFAFSNQDLELTKVQTLLSGADPPEKTAYIDCRGELGINFYK